MSRGATLAPLPRLEPLACLVTSGSRCDAPGPGTYRPASGMNAPKISIHNKFYEKEPELGVPYRSMPSTIGQGKKYSLSSRHRELGPDDTPGPIYVPPGFGFGAPKVSIGSRTYRRAPEITPGPGYYETSATWKKTINFPSHAPRPRSVDPIDLSPGPGSYSGVVGYSSPRYTIGRRYETKAYDTSPGPGAYDIGTSISPHKHKGVIGERNEVNSYGISPGPGDYNTAGNILSGIPKRRIGNRPAEKTMPSTPGYYYNETCIGKAPKYSLRSRIDGIPKDETPDANYFPPGLANPKRGVSISSRYYQREDDVTPGPGDYETTTGFLNSNRAITIHGTRERSVSVAGVSPGPAAYYPNFNTTRPKSPAFKILGARYNPKRDRSGEYVYLGSTLSGPKYTISPRCGLDVVYT